MKKELNDKKKELFTGGEWFVNWSGHPDNGRIQIGTYNDYICELYHEEQIGEDSVSWEEAKANAALISQAKNMYQQLKEICDFIENYGNLDIHKLSPMHNHMKITLNKANPNY